MPSNRVTLKTGSKAVEDCVCAYVSVCGQDVQNLHRGNIQEVARQRQKYALAGEFSGQCEKLDLSTAHGEVRSNECAECAPSTARSEPVQTVS